VGQDVRIARLGRCASLGTSLLWRALRRLEWSQNELARRLGVDSGVVSRWLHGDKRPSLRFAIQLEAFCGVAASAWHKPLPKTFTLKPTGTDG
jgi:transcriptional regulator with XRE-family HTH domain